MCRFGARPAPRFWAAEGMEAFLPTSSMSSIGYRMHPVLPSTENGQSWLDDLAVHTPYCAYFTCSSSGDQPRNRGVPPASFQCTRPNGWPSTGFGRLELIASIVTSTLASISLILFGTYCIDPFRVIPAPAPRILGLSDSWNPLISSQSMNLHSKFPIPQTWDAQQCMIRR